MNLIPKSLKKQKGNIYKNITWKDVGVFALILVICLPICLGLVFLDLWIRFVIAGVLILIFSTLLFPYSNKNDCRLYTLFVYKIKYLVSPKTYYHSNMLNPYEKIKDGYLYTKEPKDGSRHYVGCIKIRGLDISSLDNTEANIKLEQFQIFLINLKKHFSIAKINEKYCFSREVKNIKEEMIKAKEEYDNSLISEKNYKTRVEQLNNQLHIVENIYQELDTNPYKQIFYIFFYDSNLNELNRTIESATNDLESIGLFVENVDYVEEINIIKNIFNPMLNNISKETIEQDRLILDDLFTFEKVEFKKDHILINEQLYISIFEISDYPTEVDNYWLSFILLSVNANVIFNAKQISQQLAIELINKAISNTASNEYNEKKQFEKMKLAIINENYKKMSQDIIRKNQCIFKTNILILNYDVDYKSLMKSNSNIEKTLATKLIKVNHLKYRQFEGLSAFLPKMNDCLMEDNGREVPSKTIAMGYPFIENNLNDDKGMILGKNWLNNPIIFNPFKLDLNRKNHNMLVMGASGSGKSYFIKKLINHLAMYNKRVFILDPEREYRDLTDNYDGDWLDVGMGNNSIINPLEVININKEYSNKNLILDHLLFLESFFKLIFVEITENQLRYLTSLIKEYYYMHYLDVDFSKLEKNKWPIFDDIYKFAISELNQSNLLYDINDVNYVHEILRAELTNDGKLSHLYNKHTNISIEKRIMCYDLFNLFQKNNTRVIQAQLFLIINFIQNYVNNQIDDVETMIIIDEAHLLIDEKNPVALDFVLQMVKRIRKRNGGIVLITQNTNDFLCNDEISKKTKAIISNIQYSFFFNLAPSNLTDLVEMYKSYGSGISEQEKLYIAKSKRGQALFLVSNFDRHQISVIVSKNERWVFEHHDDENDVYNQGFA